MASIVCEYPVSVDAKGRFPLPSGYRKKLPADASSEFVVKRGDKCITMYTAHTWEVLSEEVSRLNDLIPDVTKYKRMFFHGANTIELDNAGRLLIPKALLEHAKITKEIVFSSKGHTVEIWDKEAFNNYYNEHKDNIDEITKNVVGPDFNPFAKL